MLRSCVIVNLYQNNINENSAHTRTSYFSLKYTSSFDLAMLHAGMIALKHIHLGVQSYAKMK